MGTPARSMSVADVNGGEGGVEPRYTDFQEVYGREISDLEATDLLPASLVREH